MNVNQIKFKNTCLTLWDISGNSRRLWKHYYDKVQAIIFVIDSTDNARMEIVKQELYKIINNETLLNVPILVLANK